MTIHAEVIASTISVLEHHAHVLQRAAAEARAWLKDSTDVDPAAYSTVDRMGDERVARLVAQAVYDIWEGTFLEVRLAQAHDPWVVSLVGHSHDPGDGGENLYVNATGISAEGAANALLNAIHDAAEQLRRVTVPN